MNKQALFRKDNARVRQYVADQERGNLLESLQKGAAHIFNFSRNPIHVTNLDKMNII